MTESSNHFTPSLNLFSANSADHDALTTESQTQSRIFILHAQL